MSSKDLEQQQQFLTYSTLDAFLTHQPLQHSEIVVNVTSIECAEVKWKCHRNQSSDSQLLSYRSYGVASSHFEHSSVQESVPPYVTSCQHSSSPPATNALALYSTSPASAFQTKLSNNFRRSCPTTCTPETYRTEPAISCRYIGNGKVLPYSLSSIRPSVQAVSPQVVLSHPSGRKLPLLSARPAVPSQPKSINAHQPVPNYTPW